MHKTPAIDLEKLETALTKKASYRLSDVKDKLETLAFDIVRFKSNDESANLWKIESDGADDYIVSVYEEAPETVKTAGGAWEVILTKDASTIQVYYKGDPLVKVATKTLGIPQNELPSVSRYLPTKLASNKKLVQALLGELTQPAKQAVLSKYPELI